MPRSTYEDGLTFAVADYLDLMGWVYTHFPAGEYRPVRVGAKLKRMGLKRGVPDVLIFEHWWLPKLELGYRQASFGIAIELKAPGKYPTKEQREWLGALKARGWSTHVCRTIHEVEEACKIIQGRERK